MTNLETWTHRCIGEFLESISLIQCLEETDVLYSSERNQLVSAATEAAREKRHRDLICGRDEPWKRRSLIAEGK